ncbi:hypothetical protein ACSF3A_005248, partial [Escherichia coli]
YIQDNVTLIVFLNKN